MAKRKMIAHVRYHYVKEDAGRNATIELDVDLSRFEKQYEKAQYTLDSMVMTSMEPYMPKRTWHLSVRRVSGKHTWLWHTAGNAA